MGMSTNELIRKGYEEGLPISEIAKQTGLSRVAVKSRAQRMGLRHASLNDREGRFFNNGKIDSSTLTTETEMRKPTQAELSAFKNHCEAHELPFDNWRAFWHKTHEYSAFFTNQEAKEAEEARYQQMIADVKKHAPKYKRRKYEPSGEHMLVLPQADIHVGKWASVEETGREYNSKVAVERALAGTDSLVGKAQLFGVKSFTVCIGNDILHTDNGKTTTSGTPQDTDGSWFSNFRMARDLYITMIERMALEGDVYLIFVPSNHDWRSGYALAETVAAFFDKHPHVHPVVTERHRKYLVYGQNLFMFSHGDGAKEKDLHWHLATEAAEAWSQTRFRYIYLGHLHHTIKKVQGHQNVETMRDKIGFTQIDTTVMPETGRDVNITTVPSPSSGDGWHDKQGFTSRPGMMAFLHHHTEGRVADFTQWF